MSHRSVAKVRRRLAQNSVAVLSLDVFDTLLLRDLRPEWKRFHDLARRLNQHLCNRHDLRRPVDEIMRARLVAARIAYQAAPACRGVREAALTDILALQLHALQLPTTMVEEFLEIELVQEQQSLRLNRPIADAAVEARKSGITVLLISDMYIDSGALARLVAECGGAAVYDRIYLSSEVGAAKRSGAMFDHVTQAERKERSMFLHVGDNLVSDYVMPRQHGWSAVWTPRHWLYQAVNRSWSDLGTTSSRWAW